MSEVGMMGGGGGTGTDVSLAAPHAKAPFKTIYIAAAFGEWQAASGLKEMLKRRNFTVTSSWIEAARRFADASAADTQVSESQRKRFAEADWVELLRSDTVVFIGDRGFPYGALIEVGIAIQAAKDVVVIDPQRNSVFFALRQVTVVPDTDAALAVLTT